jgi:alkanesulfonate monooxygenase SsuD/methylene tetrahydromethanopterin reductase-like flavin-dependent oxidoreductase (luciferase family)
LRLTLFINPEHRPSDDLSVKVDEHLEQVRLARSLGYDGLTIGHHLCYGSSVWLPPFETLARLVGEAEGMNIGTCVLPLPLFEPALIAQQTAFLDVLCGGRLVFGVAPGWQKDESEVVGIDHERRFSRFREGLELLERLWQGEEVTYSGKHFQLEQKTLALLPIQKPRPPFWFGGSVTPAVERAAELADTALGDSWVASSHLTQDVIEAQARTFRDKLASLGKPVPANFPVLRNIVVAPDKKTALKEAGPALSESYQVFGEWGLFREVVGAGKDQLELEELLANRVVLGSPEECAENLVALCRECGTNRVIARVQWMGMDQRVVLRTIELLANEVRPLVKAEL